MDYLTTAWCGADSSDFISSSVTNAEVLILACHGFAGNGGSETAALGFYQTGLPGGACHTDGDFALADSYVGGDTGDAPNYNINDYLWNKCKLAVLFACDSAGSPSDNPESVDAIAWSLFNQGISCVIAWRDVLSSTDIKWIPRFLDECAAGATVADACNYASTAYIDYTYNNNIKKYHIYGDGEQTLTFIAC
jgi:hypothetical protein